MTFLRVLLFVLVSVSGLSHCAFVDTLTKCSLADKECHKNIMQKALHEISVGGLKEFDIPRLDPMDLKHMKVSILDVLDFELIDGTARGIKDCIIDNTDVDIEHLRATVQFTCETVIIEGNYSVKSSSPIIKDVNAAIEGHGHGQVKIEKITVKIMFPFEIIKRGDDYFFTSELKKYKYTFKINGKVVFAADNIKLGGKDSTKEMVKLMNDNWKDLVGTFGSHFLDIALKIIYKFVRKIFLNVATKYYFIEDIGAYYVE